MLLHHHPGTGETGLPFPRLLLPAVELGGQGQVWRGLLPARGMSHRGQERCRDIVLHPSHCLFQGPL